MREIQVSTGVFALIWANRKSGEDSEDEILQRVLSNPDISTLTGAVDNSSKEEDGVYDRRNKVHFPEGSRIFRTYKGNRHSAVASSGHWIREDTGQKFSSINQLNTSIAEGPENVWNGTWQYMEGGTGRSIDILRKRQR